MSNFINKIREPLKYNRDEFVKEQASLLPRGTKILDVGAGKTPYRHLFEHCNYYAQDFAQHAGSTEGPMAEKNSWFYGKLDYVCDAISIPVEDESFDAILCTEVIEHVTHPGSVLQEISRILKPGGKLILTAPLTSGLHQEPHHYFGGFTPYYYNNRLTDFGFASINVTPNGGFFSFHSQESQRFSAWITPGRIPLIPSILLFPVFVISLPWFRLIYPIVAKYLDELDKHKPFTVGYHVVAIKK